MSQLYAQGSVAGMHRFILKPGEELVSRSSKAHFADVWLNPQGLPEKVPALCFLCQELLFLPDAGRLGSVMQRREMMVCAKAGVPRALPGEKATD